jgi:3-oxoacyl-[acyl-carrier protein] reductase
MDYPSFLEDTGAIDPEVRKQIESKIPLRRLCKPEEAAHFVATLIDGVGTFQTGQFFSIDGGWAFE